MSSPTDPETFRAGMLRFVNEILTGEEGRMTAPVEPVHSDTPLFAANLLDSLSILRLIAAVEELTGRPVTDDQVTMKNFQTIDTMTTAFCHEHESS